MRQISKGCEHLFQGERSSHQKGGTSTGQGVAPPGRHRAPPGVRHLEGTAKCGSILTGQIKTSPITRGEKPFLGKKKKKPIALTQQRRGRKVLGSGETEVCGGMENHLGGKGREPKVSVSITSWTPTRRGRGQGKKDNERWRVPHLKK